MERSALGWNGGEVSEMHYFIYLSRDKVRRFDCDVPIAVSPYEFRRIIDWLSVQLLVVDDPEYYVPPTLPLL